MTGYGAGSDQRATLAAGCDKHLTKPVAVEDVQRVLDGLSTSVSAWQNLAPSSPRPETSNASARTGVSVVGRLYRLA